MKRFLVLVLSLFAITLPISSFAGFYQSIHESQGEYTLVLHVDPSVLKLKKVEKNFTRVELPDAKAIGTAGDPELPTISRLFDLNASEYTANIEVSNPVVFSGVQVYPIQPDHKENMPKLPFAYSSAAYAKDQAPSVSVGEVASVGNAKAFAIRVNPFARHGDQLTLFQTIVIHLKPTANAKLLFQQERTSLFHYHQQNLLITNPALSKNVSAPSDVGSVMVLTSAALLADAQAYAALHPEYKMEVVAIQKGAKFNAVKQMISNRYAKGDLDTVVLYGDEKQVPTATWDENKSDSFYQYLDSTKPNYTQIAIGRIPVQNHNDAQFYNAKLTAYLGNKNMRTSKNVMLIAHSQGYPDAYTANQEAIRTADNPMGFVYNTQYGGLDATNASVLQEAPNHYALINYRGHGSDQEWWAWDKNGNSFDLSQVSLLKNTDDNVAVFFNIACETGTFESPKRDMAENLIFLKNIGSSYRGAIAVLGSSNDSYTDVNDRFDIHLFDFMEHQAHLPLGHVVALANDKLVLENGGEMVENIKMYVLFGDPLIALW